MTEKDILSKIAAHERAVAGIVDKHRAAASKLTTELKTAENSLAAFEALPTEAAVTAALAAQGTADNARKLIARLGPIERREVALRDAYVAQNSAGLLGLLESLHDVRTAPRASFRETLGRQLGELQGRASVEEDNAKYETLQQQIEALDIKLNAPEFPLTHADEALRDFRNQPNFARFQNVKEATLRIEFPSA